MGINIPTLLLAILMLESKSKQNYGCWNAAKINFMWYQNIFLFYQNKYVFKEIYLYDIKIYFYSIKISHIHKEIYFFIQLKYFLHEFFIWYFCSDHIWRFIFIRKRQSVTMTWWWKMQRRWNAFPFLITMPMIICKIIKGL